jgi:hypothetical protein
MSMALASQASAATSKPDPAVVSPANLGVDYTGFLRAGMGIVSQEKATYGFRAGEFVIQPRFLAEATVTDNFFKVDDTREKEFVFSAHLRPGIQIYNPDFKLVSLQFSTDVDVLVPASEKPSVADQTNVGVKAKAKVGFHVDRLMSVTIADSFARTLLVRPISAQNQSAHRNFNSAGADVSFHPGGGALDFTLGYRFNATIYDDLTTLNEMSHVAKVMASWRFLPLNYAFIESNLEVKDYASEFTPIGADTAENTFGNFVDGMPLKVYAGFSGYLTERIAVMIRAGYGNSLLEGSQQEDFSHFIGDTRISFRFTPRTALHVGGSRDFQLAPLGGHMEFARGYLAFEQSIAEVMLIHVDAGLDYRVFGRWTPASQEVGEDNQLVTTCIYDDDTGECVEDTVREDYMLKAGLLLDFNISRWFGISAGYRFNALLTDFATKSTFEDFNEDTISYQSYMEHRAFLTFNLRY